MTPWASYQQRLTGVAAGSKTSLRKRAAMTPMESNSSNSILRQEALTSWISELSGPGSSNDYLG